jgi:hypothetical protein
MWEAWWRPGGAVVRRLLFFHADNMKAETAAYHLAERHHMVLILG